MHDLFYRLLANYTHFKCVCSHMLISGGHTHKEIHLYFHYLQFGHYRHPPLRRGPAAIGPRRPNSPHHRDPLQPPVLRHPFPARGPNRRQRTAAELAADRPGRAPPSPPLPVALSAPLSPWLVGPRYGAVPATVPSLLGHLGRKARLRPRPHALWAKIPPGPVKWRIPFLFLFPIFLSHFHIYI
jgi:hypothetical protein